MDLSRIVQFRLLKSEYTPPTYSDKYRYENIDIFEFKKDPQRLLNISEMIKNQIEWGGVPDTFEKLYKRFKSNSFCQIWIYDDTDIGWYWYNHNVSLDWLSIDKKLNPNEIYVGGAFVSNKVERPANSSFIFYNFSFINAFNELNKDTVYIYGDDWNRASNILMYKSGCKQFNYLK
jgi:hypothetical protein